MRILALDLATKLGWAWGDTRYDDVLFGMKKLPSTGDDIGAFAVAFDVWLRAFIADKGADYIAFEAPMAHTSGRSTLTTTLKLGGLCWHGEFVARSLGIRCGQVAAPTWKKAFTGTGRVSKKMKPYPVIVQCQSRGWEVQDDNAADALGIFCYAAGAVDPDNGWRFDPLNRSQIQKEVPAEAGMIAI